MNNAATTDSIFNAQDNGTAVFTIGDNGTVLAKNSADSTAAFQLQNAAGTTLFNIDTTSSVMSLYGELGTPYGGFGRYSNLILNSETFDTAASGAVWAETNVTAPAADTIVAPDGTTTAESLVSTVAGGSDAQNSATAIGGTYTFSVWLKSTGAITATIRDKKRDRWNIVKNAVATTHDGFACFAQRIRKAQARGKIIQIAWIQRLDVFANLNQTAPRDEIRQGFFVVVQDAIESVAHAIIER